MKNLLILLILTPLFSIAQNIDSNNFIGKWTGEEKGEMGAVIFENNGFAFWELDGQIVGGKEFMFEGEKKSLTYRINTHIDPIQIDFIITNLISGEVRELVCIAKFVDADNILLTIGFDIPRPTEFNTNNSLKLTRAK